MKCKYCNEEMPEKGNFCPICGGDNSLEPEIIIDPEELIFDEAELPADEMIADAEEPVEEEPMEEEHFEPSPALKRARLMSGITGCIAVLGVLAVVLFAGISGSFSEDGKGWDIGAMFDWLIPRENNLYYKDSYTVDAQKAMKKRDDVVATVPGAELTNGQLQIYYWTSVYDFLNENSYYLSYYGLDYSRPLDEQTS